jgi:hypothetical protein
MEPTKVLSLLPFVNSAAFSVHKDSAISRDFEKWHEKLTPAMQASLHEDAGCVTALGFTRVLLRRYGNGIAAWAAFSKGENLSPAAFNCACVDTNIHVDPELVFAEMIAMERGVPGGKLWRLPPPLVEAAEAREPRISFGFQRYISKEPKAARNELLQVFGSRSAAWDALDVDGLGRISYLSFCNVFFASGFTGNHLALFAALDTDQDGFILLTDVDPQAAPQRPPRASAITPEWSASVGYVTRRAIVTLMARSDPKSPQPIVDVWQSLLRSVQAEPFGGITLVQLIEICRKQKWAVHCRRIMGSQDRLFLSDLDVAASKMLKEIHDTRSALARVAAESFDRRLERVSTLERTSKDTPKRVLASDGADAGESAGEERDSKLSAWNSEHDNAAAFRKLLKKTFGSVEKAWKDFMDEDHNGELSYIEFVHTCRALGFRGKPQAVFAELDFDMNGVLTLQELDPDAGRHAIWEAWREQLWDDDLRTTAKAPVPLYDMPYFKREEARRELEKKKRLRREDLKRRVTVKAAKRRRTRSGEGAAKQLSDTN